MEQQLAMPGAGPVTGATPAGSIEAVCADIERRARDVARYTALLADAAPRDARPLLSAAGWLHLAAEHLVEASERLTVLGLRAGQRIDALAEGEETA